MFVCVHMCACGESRDLARDMAFKQRLEDVPGGPVVKTPYFHCRGHGFVLVEELRFHVTCGVAKKIKIKSEK